MRLAISNLAWSVADDAAVGLILSQQGIDAIDIAPGKYFADPQRASDPEIAAVRALWASQGIDITGMQALLFGTSGLNLFGPAEVQRAMLDHLAAIARIGALLGATRLTFGSPRNRDRRGLADEEANAIATEFFWRLGEIGAREGVVFCLEANPPRYDSNFMVTTLEAARVVRQVGHKAIRLQIDTGALKIAEEDPDAVLTEVAPLVGHIHISEPDLVETGTGGVEHARLGRILGALHPRSIATLEMATPATPGLAALTRAIALAKMHYEGSH